MTVVFHCDTPDCGNKLGELIPMETPCLIDWTCGVCRAIYVIEVEVVKEVKNDDNSV